MPEINPINGKIVVRINASSLVYSKCTKHWHLVIVDGYKEKVGKAAAIYGVAAHAYINTMFKTSGRIDLARKDALAAFNVPKNDNRQQKYLSDEKHLLGTCFNLWDDWIEKEKDFDHLMINSKCYWCDGEGKDSESGFVCTHCKGAGSTQQPATEVTFSILYYEDAFYEVWLEGTADKIGKIKNGCYAIGDYKTTSSSDDKEYLANYEMSAQLRFYVLSLKLMAEKYPDSILGQIGATRIGAFIDGVFVRSNTVNNTYARSTVYIFKDEDLAEFRVLLDNAIQKLLTAMTLGTQYRREGIFNGACEPKFGSKCPFWFVCMSGSKEIEKLMLARDFKQKQYNPLKHND